MGRLTAKMRRAPHWLRNKLAPGAVILCYHRIADDPHDPYEVCVTPRRFAEQLEAIRECGRPVRLQELVAKIREGNLPRRAIVVTFDDGYADNLHAAKPLLERYDVPATVFVATGSIARKREFWWDELEHLLLRRAETLPEVLSLRVGGKDHRWELGAARHYDKCDREKNRGWMLNAPEMQDAHPRLTFFRALYFLVRAAPHDERAAVIDELSAWSGGGSDVRPTHRTMSESEIHELATGSLVEVGAHTVTHPMLSTLSEPSQRREVKQSKSELENILGSPVNSFAYPHGDYNAETVASVRDAGYLCACTTESQVIRQGTDLFHLPRIGLNDQQVMSGEWDGERLGKLLRWLALG